MDAPDSAPAAALLSRLQALCPMRCQELSFPGQTLELWTACDVDPLLEALAAKPADDPDVLDERMPYWAELWPSSLLLARHLFHSESLPAGPWIELGCGPGLAGLAVSLRGIPGLWTDYMPEALLLAELNARHNHCPSSATLLLDWRAPPADLSASWILAADVAYETRLFEPLLHCFNRLLAPGGEIWFGEPGRPIARPFFDQLSAAGWQRETLCIEDGRHLYRLRRPSS
jgi:predicted nicotinamide N-methyase